jgi:hypothetical protein
MPEADSIRIAAQNRPPSFSGSLPPFYTQESTLQGEGEQPWYHEMVSEMSHWHRKREESEAMLQSILSQSDGAASLGPKRTTVLTGIQTAALTLQEHFRQQVHRIHKNEMLWLAQQHGMRDQAGLEELGTLYNTMFDTKRAVDTEPGTASQGT